MITSSESSADYTSAKNIIYPELNPEAYLASQDAFKETIRVQNFGVVSLTRKCTHLLAQLLRTSQSDSIHDLDQGEASFKQFIEPSIETHPNLSFFLPHLLTINELQKALNHLSLEFLRLTSKHSLGIHNKFTI